MDNWKKIKKAPKNDIPILAAMPVEGSWVLAVVIWEPSHQCWANVDNWPWETFNPTHWMETPEPPHNRGL